MRNRPRVIYITQFSKQIMEQYIEFADSSYLVENHVEIGKGKMIHNEANVNYLFIGRMSDEKSPRLFCEAVSRAGVKGIVIGDGPDRKNLERDYPDITFTGWLTSRQMEKHIDSARALIVTSKWYETMGLTIIEMQARGIPCSKSNRKA